MRPNNLLYFLAAILCLSFTSCGKEDTQPGPVRVLAVTVNGAPLVDGAGAVPAETTVSVVFSSALDPAAFEAELSLSPPPGPGNFSISYANGASRANLDLTLAHATTYTLRIGTGGIGADGARLAEPVMLTFTTAEDDLIRSMAPCTSTGDCRRSVLLSGTEGGGRFEFYSNYPVYEENARWEDLTQAVIVVHGASHNPDDYFSYLTNTLNALSLSENTVLLAPFFRSGPTASDGDLYWDNLRWRDGRTSSNTNKVSSFQALDALIARLADSEHFPVLKRIVVTGQSSGGRFTHVYAPANRSEGLFPDIDFHYIVSESQYFYYPDGRRIAESSNELYVPTGCAGYDIWPFGYNVTPTYLQATNATEFNQQFVNRSIIYLLGNGGGPDNALNTTDCGATLLGATRYQRGENMFRYMELAYPGQHNHAKTVAAGISHDGSAIYQSPEFRSLLTDLLE